MTMSLPLTSIVVITVDNLSKLLVQLNVFEHTYILRLPPEFQDTLDSFVRNIVYMTDGKPIAV
jgi:hypothetical protein